MSDLPLHNVSETDRRTLTFAQAEGVDPLPTQLALKEVSPRLAAALWEVVYLSLLSTRSKAYPNPLGNDWIRITRSWFVEHLNSMADEYTANFDVWLNSLKSIFVNRNYIAVFEFIQFVIRHPSVPRFFEQQISLALEANRAAYIVVDKTLFPKASAEEGVALQTAHQLLAASPFQGSRTHLRHAGQLLTEGDFSGSVRESISAVEGVAKAVEPDADTLGKALVKLERSGALHAGLRKAFGALYGYSSDQQGVRHALVLEDVATVDEADALFMLGACASFITFVLRRTQSLPA